MRTIGYKIRDKASQGGYPAMCACGLMWPRNKLRRSADGQLRCPAEKGRDAVELDHANAQSLLAHNSDDVNPYGHDGDSPMGTIESAAVATPALEFLAALRGAAEQTGLKVQYSLLADTGVVTDDNDRVLSWRGPPAVECVSVGGQEPLFVTSDIILGGRSSIVSSPASSMVIDAYPPPGTPPTFILLVGYPNGDGSLAGRSVTGTGTFSRSGGALSVFGASGSNPFSPVGQAARVLVYYGGADSFIKSGAVTSGIGAIGATAAGSRRFFTGPLGSINFGASLLFEAWGSPTEEFQLRADTLIDGYYSGAVLL